jgi:hypothetical protein
MDETDEEKEREREMRGRMYSVESLHQSHLSIGSEIPSTLPIDRVQEARLLIEDLRDHE